MRKILYAFLFIAILIPFFSFALPVVHIKADHISYNKKMSTYYAYGNCLVNNGKYSIKADKIVYNETTSVVQAKGNVFIEDLRGDWIKGKYAKLNYSNYKGYIRDAVAFVKNDNLYIKASYIIMYGKDRYYAKDSRLTSCKCKEFVDYSSKCNPKWSLNASNTYIVIDDYLFSYPVVFKAKSVPLLFIPFVNRSLNKKRKTGFLMPQIGFSSVNGYTYIQPFFINLTPSQDITLYPFMYSRKGEGIEGEYRFYWTRHSKGKWKVTIFRDKVPYQNSSKRTRLNIKAIQRVDFGKYGEFDYDLNLVNNRNNLRVINRNNIALSSDRYTISTASYYLAHNEYFLSIYGNYRQDLIAENNKNTLQDLPIMKFGVIGKRLYKNLTFDFTQTVANEFRVEGQRGLYTDSSGFLYYPFNVSYFNITPKIGVHRLWSEWKDAPDDSKYYKSSFIPDYIISTDTKLIGIFLNDNNRGFVGLKHVIKPMIEYEYIPERSQDFPDFVSTYSKTNLLTFTLENNVVAKYLFNDNSSVYKNVFYNKIVFQYDFAKKYHTAFPPIYEETVIKPFKFLSFVSKAHYFFKRHLFTDSTESLNMSNKSFGFKIGYSMSRDSSYDIEDDTISSNIYFYLLNNLYLYIEAKKSTIHHYYPERKFGFSYSGGCWGVGVDFYLNRIAESSELNEYNTHLDRGFWITLSLTGLFSIKRQY